MQLKRAEHYPGWWKKLDFFAPHLICQTVKLPYIPKLPQSFKALIIAWVLAEIDPFLTTLPVHEPIPQDISIRL